MQILNTPNPMFHQQSYKMESYTIKFRSRTNMKNFQSFKTYWNLKTSAIVAL